MQPEGRADTGVLVYGDDGTVMQSRCVCLGRALRGGMRASPNAGSLPFKLLPMTMKCVQTEGSAEVHHGWDCLWLQSYIPWMRGEEGSAPLLCHGWRPPASGVAAALRPAPPQRPPHPRPARPAPPAAYAR